MAESLVKFVQRFRNPEGSRDGRSFGRHQSRRSIEVRHSARGCRVTEISTEAETRGERTSERTSELRTLEFSRRPFDLFEPTSPSRSPDSRPSLWSAQTRRYRPRQAVSGVKLNRPRVSDTCVSGDVSSTWFACFASWP